jgi:hypothetical protein
MPVTEVVGLDDVLGRIVNPADLLAAFAGHRGAPLKIGVGEP